MLPKVLASFGGPHVDTKPQSDPTGQVPAALYDRLCEDVAQLTRPGARAIVWFDTLSGGALPYTYPAANVNHKSQWGTGAAQKPTVVKTAQGRYTITYAATFTDPLGIIETVNFVTGDVQCYSADPLDQLQDSRPLTISGNIATIVTKATEAAADVGNSSAAVFRVKVTLY